MKINLKFIASLCALFLCYVASAQASKKQMPNIIFILADDMGYGDLGCYGQQKIMTPNLDAMAKSGIRFTQYYSGSTVCGPSRCALMTGKHTGHTAIRGNVDVKGIDGKIYDMPLPEQELTIAELLKKRNYSTACIGKWGLGGIGTTGHPNNQGFDYFYGYLGQANAHWYYPEYIHENSNEIILSKKVYTHDLFENKALDFIKNNAHQAFFLYLPVTIPHAELQIPSQYRTMYENSFQPEKPHKGDYSPQEKPLATFAAMVTRLDATVGKINKLLAELKIADNTMVIFSSDNGPHKEGGANPQFFNSTGGLRGAKRDLYEGGIRVPMIVKWPKIVKPGIITHEPSAFWDVLPTLLDATKIDTVIQTDGLSFLPILKQKKQTQKHPFFYWEFYEMGGKQAVIADNWKLIKLNARDSAKAYYELYNLKDDLAEKNNLIQSEKAKADSLNKWMIKEHQLNPRFKW